MAIKRLHVYLAPIMLRRTKDTEIDGKPILNLPPREVHEIKTDFFDEDERTFYKHVAEKVSVTINKYLKGNSVINYTSVLTGILRMRQACNHPHLSECSLAPSYTSTDQHITQQSPKAQLSRTRMLSRSRSPETSTSPVRMTNSQR